MAFVSIYNEYLIPLLVLFFVSSELFNGINGFENHQEVPTTKLLVVSHELCHSCPREVSSFKDVKTYSELKYDPRASLPSSFTICVSVLVTTDNINPSLFTLLGNDGQPWFSAGLWQQGNLVRKQFYYPVPNQWVKIDTVRMFPHHWVRSCLALNTLSGLVQWVARGKLVDNSTLTQLTNNVPKDLRGKIILGSDYFSYKAKWISSSNKLTKLEIFSSALDVKKMMEYTKGEGCGDDGDYLSWDKMQWNLHGKARIEHMEAEETCTMSSWNYYKAPFEMSSCMHFCQKLRGSRYPLMNSLQQLESVTSLLRKKEISQYKVWVPFHDRQNEGEWRDFYNHQVLNFTPPWGKSEPNGGTSQNCAIAVDSNVWWDVTCDWPGIPCLCQRHPSFYLILRGLCAQSAVDKYYEPMNSFSDFAKLKLVGLSKSSIEYDGSSKHWKLSSAGSNVSGLSHAPQNTYLLGKQNWAINGDSNCKTNGEEYSGHLKFTGCNTIAHNTFDYNNFTCDDGQCVTMEQRCNQHPDCRDHSDETGCDILALVKGYNKNVPPVPLKHKDKRMVNVSVSIDILKVVDVDEEGYSIKIQFSIFLKWVENRATYQNLKKNRFLNALTQNEIELLWLPKVIFENTDQKESTRLGMQFEWATNVVVERNKNGTPAGLETVDETDLFKGEENNLLMSQTYTHDFQCIYNLKRYPFDIQTCYIEMAMGPLDEASVTLNPAELNMNQSPSQPRSLVPSKEGGGPVNKP